MKSTRLNNIWAQQFDFLSTRFCLFVCCKHLAICLPHQLEKLILKTLKNE